MGRMDELGISDDFICFVIDMERIIIWTITNIDRGLLNSFARSIHEWGESKIGMVFEGY
jgi:hypothetical protein